jgi:acetyl-CoA acyltransferase
MNFARTISIRAGLPDTVPAETINRYCSSGVQSIAHIANAIQAGQIEIGIGGGVESMSMVPMMGYKFSPNPHFAMELPHYYTNMGLTAENVAAKYGITREQQDEFALHSNQKAAHAVDSGIFDPELLPIDVELTEYVDGKTVKKNFTVKRDEGPRGDSTIEGLAKLKPAFKDGGSVTAGNSSQMSDGASAVMVMSAEKASRVGTASVSKIRFLRSGRRPA